MPVAPDTATILVVPGLRDHVAQHWQTLLAARVPGTVRTSGMPSGTTTFCVPPGCESVSSRLAVPTTLACTVALVILELGSRSHALCPGVVVGAR